MRPEKISVEGMSCQHCVARVEAALAGLDGVDVEQVEIGEVRVSIDPDRADRSAVASAIREAGYTPA